MRNLLIVSAIALAAAGTAQAGEADLSDLLHSSTCSGLHLTGYAAGPQQPVLSACCNEEQRDCPRYLSIKPVPRRHLDLKT